MKEERFFRPERESFIPKFDEPQPTHRQDGISSEKLTERQGEGGGDKEKKLGELVGRLGRPVRAAGSRNDKNRFHERSIAAARPRSRLIPEHLAARAELIRAAAHRTRGV